MAKEIVVGNRLRIKLNLFYLYAKSKMINWSGGHWTTTASFKIGEWALIIIIINHSRAGHLQ